MISVSKIGDAGSQRSRPFDLGHLLREVKFKNPDSKTDGLGEFTSNEWVCCRTATQGETVRGRRRRVGPQTNDPTGFTPNGVDLGRFSV